MLHPLVPLRRSSVLLACALSCAAAVAGCGSQEPAALPPAAEPPNAPSLTTKPAGRVTVVGKRPEGIVADGRSGLVAVALRRPARLAVVSAATGKVVERVSLPGAPRHLQLATDGPSSRVLVPDEDADTLAQVSLGGEYDGKDVPIGRIVAQAKVGRQPHDATPLGAGGEVAVGAELGNLLQIVRGDRVVRQERIALQPGGLAPIDGGRIVAVVAVKERVLELYDTRTLKRLASAPAGVGPTHVVCRDEGICYVADTTGKAILIFVWQDGKLQLQRRQWLSSQPYGIALDEERYKVWVTLPAENKLVELRARTRSRTGRIFPAVEQPQTVAVDPVSGHVFVTGATDGVLQTLRP
ncbi:YncE family protein [Patulibacter americanus]|uniref:YncE family protein n=1 Tax=Patulibacter americanus TaxID=588672 RepID=UPI00042677BD|nr:YncE family protein [Patulibacter americanus]